MDQRGTQLAPLVELDDLRTLVEEIVETPDDVLSVCLPFGAADEELATEVGLRWRALRDQATRAGTPEDVLTEVDRAVDGAHRGGAGLHVVAGHGRTAHVEGLERPPAQSTVSWGVVPALVPLLTDRQRRQPHVVALVDRRGADVIASPGRDVTGDAATHQTAVDAVSRDALTTVRGATYPLRKVAPGGWSQRRYQQHAAETWRHNMVRVAAELVAQAEQVGAHVVAVGGDDRAVRLLVDHLPDAVVRLVRPLPVSRAADGSATRLDHEVDRLLDTWLHDQLARTLDTYQEELGQHDRAVAGTTDTLAALRASRVAVLLVAGRADPDPTTAEASAWIGRTADDIAPVRDALTHPPQGRPVPLQDGAITAALATGADVRVLPDTHDSPNPLAALLRW